MRIAIVGAGIAGLASALVLSGRGHEITVCERRTGFGESGAGIQLSPNASRVLIAMGLGPALARQACEPDGIVVRRLSSGREIGSVALGPRMRERFGAPFLSIARSDLHTALLDAVRGSSDIRLRVGRTLAGIEGRDREVEASFTAEGGRAEALAVDTLVGADGLWSRARTLAGDSRAPVPDGFAAYRATLPIAALPEGLAHKATGLWLGRGRHVVHYPIAGGERLNLVVVARRADRVEGWSHDEERARVLDLLAGSAPKLRDLAAAAGTWSAWSLHDLAARHAASGRVALVGDAAHPVLPYLAQGGSLAIEDAARLAAHLCEDPRAVPAALAAYARERLPRVRRVQAAARRNGSAYHAAGPVALVRDLVMRRLGPDGMRERYAWLYGWSETDGRAPA